MSIEMNKLNYGVMLGFKLARLEFIWGSPYDFAIKEFDGAKNEIMLLINSDNIKIDDKDYISFSSSIINYYMLHDSDIFYSILIGNCLQRSLLISKSNNTSVNMQIEALARSSLNAIPEDIIGDKQEFFIFIKEQNSDNFDLFTATRNIHRYISNPSLSSPVQSGIDNDENDYQIFISYRREGGDALAGRLADRFMALGYKVFFDVESMRSGTFNTQILNAIDQCTDVLLVLPPNALDRCVNEKDWVRQELAFALKKNKNVIPVIMRGFEFPDTLPDDIENVRNMEGVTASSEYFDAVIQRIEKLLCCRRLPIKEKKNVSLKKDYISFVSSITVSDYLEANGYFEDGNDISVSGGVFYLCQKILSADDIDDSGREEFERLLLVLKTIYKMAKNKGKTEICAYMQTISKDAYIEASRGIKDYMLAEINTLQGEFIDYIFQSLSTPAAKYSQTAYWETMLKEIFILVRMLSE